MQTRRGFLSGLGALIAAPAIVRATSLMPVKAMPPDEVLRAISPDSIMEEIAAVARRAFVPRVFVQLYQAHPFLEQLRAEAA